MGRPFGTLTLVPTPISRKYTPSPSNIEILQIAFERGDLILVEDLKPSRQRWVSWGLPREAINSFICYNEQTWSETLPKVLSQILSGKNAVIFSDGGMPVIADPGRELVFQLRENGASINCGSFDNSFLMGLALSGFQNDRFEYLGFPPREKGERREFWQSLKSKPNTLIIMDTGYRLNRVQEEVIENLQDQERLIYIGCNLNTEGQIDFWGKTSRLKHNRIEGKHNFVLCIGPV